MKMHTWTKSSYSGPEPDNHNCVELYGEEQYVWVRDSKDVEKGTLAISTEVMGDFMRFVRSL